MAHKKHLSKLLNGISEWNKSRSKGLFRQPNLVKAKLSGAKLSGANLSAAKISGATLSGADLSRANLRDADLSGSKLSDTDLSDADLSFSKATDADLRGVALCNANLSYADLSGANLLGADFQGATLTGTNINDANLLDARGLSTAMLVLSNGSDSTRLPPTIGPPSGWLIPEEEDAKQDKPLEGPIADTPTEALVLPTRTGPALAVEFDGSSVSRAANPPPERSDLENLYGKVLREAGRLRDRGGLHNVSPDLAAAVRDYLEALPTEYEHLDEIDLGLEGTLLDEKFKGAQEGLTKEFPEEAGLVSALLLAHSMLAARLPRWRAFLQEEQELGGVPEDAEETVIEAAEDIADSWDAINDANTIDPEIVETIRHYASLAKLGVEDATFAVARVIEDVLLAIVRYLSDIATGAFEEARPGLKKSLSKIITITAIGGAATLATQLPWFEAWFSKGYELLKMVGVV